MSPRRLIRVTLATCALAALLAGLYAAAGTWLAPRLLKNALVEFASGRLGHELELRAVRVDPWRLVVELEGARLRARSAAGSGAKPAPDLASFERLTLDLEGASLWRDEWRLRRLALHAPRVQIAVGADGALNWAALLAALPRDDRSPPPRIAVARATVARGEIAYEDHAGARPRRLQAGQITLDVKGFSTEKGRDAAYTLTAVAEDGARLSSTGLFDASARKAAGAWSVAGLQAATLSQFLSGPAAPVSGTLEGSAQYAMRGDAGTLVLERIRLALANVELELAGGSAGAAALALEGGRYLAADGSARFERLTLRGARLAAEGADAPRMELAVLALEGIALVPGERSLRMDAATLAGLKGHDERDQQGASLLAGLFAGPPAATGGGGPAPAWTVTLGRLDVTGTALRVASRSGNGGELDLNLPRAGARELQFSPGDAPSFSIGQLEAEGGQLRHTPEGAPARALAVHDFTFAAAALRYPDGDPVQARAAFSLAPAGKVEVAGELDLRRLSATLAVRVAALPLALAQPWITPHLALHLRRGSLSADGKLRIAGGETGIEADYTGGLAVRDLALEESAGKAPLFNAAAIDAKGVAFRLQPLAVSVDALVLEVPAGRVSIDPDGRLNLGNLRPGGQESRPADAALAEGARSPVKLRKITLRNGRLEFADRSIRPAFAVRIDELDGTITGLDSTQSAAAAVKLSGRVGQFGAARISGALDPFAPGARTSLTLDFRNLEMSALDPYARRFAGYRVESGKLSGELRYRVREARLEGENHLVIEKLKLGERVASERAADLPLDLAIALLSDSEGRIDLKIPVRGDLDRPEFDLGQIIAQAVGGALRKTLAAPFMLLASLFGGGEAAIDRIYFEPGSAKLAPPEREKIEALARALQARPQLALEVSAAFDAGADADALRAAKVAVDPAILRALAQARADSIRAALLAQGADAARISLAEPGVAGAEGKLGVPAKLSLGAR